MIFWLLITFILLILLLTTLLNTLMFPRLAPLPLSHHGQERLSYWEGEGKVSILIPARNESAVIASTIRHLLAQSYPPYEILLLDDHSTDGTADIARSAAENDSRLKIIPGQPLPPQWLGKNWACHQLSQAAQGDFLIFTDADVEWGENALAALLPHFATYEMLTVWPTQKTVTWGERLCVSAIALAIISYLPEMMVRFSPFSAFAAANGQCLAFTRDLYTRIGGHQAVHDNIVEDVGLAKAVKKKGGKLMMLDGNRQICCRMYRNWSEVRNGFAKNILAGHGNSLIFLAFSTLFHWAVFVLPFVWLICGNFIFLGAGWPLFPLVLIGLGLLVRAIGLWVTRQRVHDAVWMPLTVMLMTRIAAQAAWWQLREGGPQWKGRTFVKKT